MWWVALLCLAAGAQAEPDEELLGKLQNYPIGNVNTWYQNPNRVGSWSDQRSVPGIRTRKVSPPASASPLLPAANGPAVSAAIAYRYRGSSYTLAQYLERQRATGLLILKNGEIVTEHYRYGRTPDARFLSFSMAKSVTSLLIGIALEQGLIKSIDDTAETYDKSLVGSPYGATTVRQLLRMSSGLVFTERYDGNDDISRLSRASAGASSAGRPVDVLRSVSERHAPAGSKFVYASAETAVLGRVLSNATQKNLAELTTDWLWKPIGAENDAFWRISIDGQEQTQGGFNASLRDWGRLGLLLAKDGRVDGKAGRQAGAQTVVQVLPREYLLDATDPARQPQAFKPRSATPYFGYGYQFWLMPFKERTFAMQGIHGQTLYVQPATGVVMVLTSVWEQASGRQDVLPYQERDALWRGVLRALGGDVTE